MRVRLFFEAEDCFVGLLGLRFFFVGSWGSQLLCKPFFRFFMDQKKTRKPRTFSGGGGGGGGGMRSTDQAIY